MQLTFSLTLNLLSLTGALLYQRRNSSNTTDLPGFVSKLARVGIHLEAYENGYHIENQERWLCNINTTTKTPSPFYIVAYKPNGQATSQTSSFIPRIQTITTTGEKPTKQPLQKNSVYNDALLHGNNNKHIAWEKKISMFRNTISYIIVPQ